MTSSRLHSLSLYFLLILLFVALPEIASAYFRTCNDTGHRINISIGYYSDVHDSWVSEGWWDISGGSCKTLIDTSLYKTKYYLFAYTPIHNLIWQGNFGFCVSNGGSFTIVGGKNCSDRGYISGNFFEVNVGSETNYIHRLNDDNSKNNSINNSISSIDVIWWKGSFDVLTSELTIEEIAVLGFGVLATDEDFYVANVKITNTGNIPVKIDPDNIHFFVGNIKSSAISNERGKFLSTTLLSPNHSIEGVVLYHAPKNNSEPVGIKYIDNSIQISYSGRDTRKFIIQ